MCLSCCLSCYAVCISVVTFLPFCNRSLSVFLHRKKQNMIFTFFILLSDCEHEHVLYDKALINHLWDGGGVDINVLITNYEPVLSKVVYKK